jgi:hypothetical protein
VCDVCGLNVAVCEVAMGCGEGGRVGVTVKG